jgi:hypothetical protein
MAYTHVLSKGGHGVRSPMDGPQAGLCSLHKPEWVDAEKVGNQLK